MESSNLNELKIQMENIETTQAFQDDTIESLQKTVAVQHQEIQMLQTQLTLLSEYIKNMKEGGGIKLSSEETPPPHY